MQLGKAVALGEEFENAARGLEPCSIVMCAPVRFIRLTRMRATKSSVLEKM
jgi:hypothetical protein